MAVILIVACVLILSGVGVLVFAAVAASRSKPREPEKTLTQQVENPYRKFYK